MSATDPKSSPRVRPTSLHTPLATPDRDQRNIWLWSALALVVVAAVAAAWFWNGLRLDETAASVDARVPLGHEVEVAANGGRTDAADETETVTIDGQEVQTLSPLEPLEPLDPVGETTAPVSPPPVFKPQVAVPVRSHPGVAIPELVEKSEFGPLPRVGASGLRPLDAYAAPPQASGAARIAVVVGGLGLSQTGTREAIEALPASVTLAFSPYGNSLNRWMTEARRKGHEVVLQLPMEPLGYPTINPGPRTLTRAAGTDTNLANLRWALGRMTNYPIVMNYLGAGMVTKTAPMEAVLEEVHQRGLAWFDDGTVAASVVPALTRQNRIPNARGTLTIDASRDDARITASLAALEQTAKRRGFAIGTATAFPTSVSLIADWANKTQASGVSIVPLSALIKDYAR